MCHLCGKFNESIAHITSGCPMLLDSKYKKHHDEICTYLHWCISRDHNMLVSNSWHRHNSQPATKFSDHNNLHYGMTVEVDHGVSANCPNIIIHNSAKKCTSFINITVPMGINMVKAAAENIRNIGTWRLHIRRSSNCE
eukprot:1429507-Ditylum_brightwellii.AAC.1